MSGSQWSWRLLDAEDRPVDQRSAPVFTTRFDAESWLGEHWRELAAHGVVGAELTEQGVAVGPVLPLHVEAGESGASVDRRVLAPLDPRLGQPCAADLEGAQHSVHQRAAGDVVRAEPLGEALLEDP